ncbi:MAG: hypothetical protein KKB03_03790 [Nanoarchaeota archaeon]|nr:hypothetical protein [Nanoarchaeota archaeon]MBU1135287.1 hypothetical protein [Nanoarchaeota archaeon]MBU2520336.1 hypothetical protein [Nanoarchaeota archaeon]
MARSRNCSDLRKNYYEVKEKVDALRDLYGPLEDSIFSKETERILSDMMGSIISSESSINDDIEKRNRDVYFENRNLLLDYLQLIKTYHPFRCHEIEKDFGYMSMKTEPFDKYIENASNEMQRLN